MTNMTQIVDGWQVHVDAHELRRGDVIRRLEPKAMQVLVRLAARPGAVVSRAELLDTVWDGTFVGDDALSAVIIKLRRAFGDNARAPRVIETVHKSGYRLIANVDSVERIAAAAPTEQRRSRVTLGTVLRCAFRLQLPERTPVDPEEWMTASDRVVAAIADAVQRHGGRPIRESDAVIGVFGAPVAQEHHAVRGVRAAIAIRRALDGLAEGGTPQVTWRLALTGGELLWVDDRDFSVHGIAVQQLGVLLEAARAGEVLVARQTLELAGGSADTIGTGEAAVLEVDAAWEGTTDRPVTPLVGREHETSRIAALALAARGGRGQLVALCGEPGSGKSRLVREALLRLPEGTRHSVASASPLEAHTPFYPLRRGLTERLRVDSQRLADSDALREQLDEAGHDVPALLAVLRPDDGDDGWLRIDPDVRRDRCFTALTDALIDGQRFTVLVFEDLHWADELTLSFITSVVTTLARRPVVVIVTYRPGFTDPWAAKSYHTLLRVEPLRDNESLRILDHLAGHDPTVQPWKSAVIRRSDGTPLFAEEVVRTARTAGTLQGELGALTLAHDADTVDIPASIHAVVADRLDRLSDDAQYVLSLAAVIGRDVPADLLDALADGAVADSRRCLEELQAAELLHDAGFRRDPAYVFQHALTQEVAYRAMPQSQRRQHHRRVADLLESGAMVHASPELIARHRSGAGQPAQAAEAWLRAAHTAITAAAFADALDHLHQARTALSDVDSADRDRLDLSISLSAASALIQSVGPADAEVERTYRHARVLAAASGSPRQRFEAGWGLWFVHLMRGDITAAQPLATDMLGLADDLDDALHLEAHHMQWAGLTLAGDVAGAHHHAEVGITRYESARHHWLTYSFGGHDPGVCALNLGSMALWLIGRPDQARERSTAAMTLATELGHPYTHIEASNGALTIALLEGDAASLLQHTQPILDLVEEGKLPAEASAYADGYRANALILDGDLTGGLRLLDAAAPTWQAFWGAWCFPLDSAYATALALNGETGRALAHIDQRLAYAEQSGAHWWHAEFHRVRGELLRAMGSDEAEACLRAAVDVAREQKAAFLEQRAIAGLAR